MSKLVNLNTLLNLEDDVARKVCLYCKKEKALADFPKHSLYKDKLDTRCRECIKKQSSLRQKLHKTAPAPPTLCECCGKKPMKFCLDHDHTSNEFRGWLCDPCNTGIGKLGDDIEGVLRALKYLKQKQQKNSKKTNKSKTIQKLTKKSE